MMYILLKSSNYSAHTVGCCFSFFKIAAKIRNQAGNAMQQRQQGSCAIAAASREQRCQVVANATGIQVDAVEKPSYRGNRR
jgi:hypothetical protein